MGLGTRLESYKYMVAGKRVVAKRRRTRRTRRAVRGRGREYCRWKCSGAYN
jgi:hypothetical protein